MIYLLTYDGYMKEEKLQEICPSAILFMQCGLKDCVLEFRRFYETAMPTLEVGEAERTKYRYLLRERTYQYTGIHRRTTDYHTQQPSPGRKPKYQRKREMGLKTKV